ncbi:solute carrier family 28 member 3-like isoform X2 [Ostrea edulis]|nr:solute carrier family 28 member 3-like isoform X2 [Ostrea edulis]XP_048753841.1 solute carrier family 28 member 3-like isoform X2 [Ostrea edulis]XP_048753842.1 solute carrier family 28 member 3-like isoform X2 [Ostrea edulis]XP_048753843.1 solute carrier family 28 member 3-like isoform X2 [Ostrea edulis]XP_056008140.1 solute carrier family 28 member 3-like isoform X2 [Ostrea edulis]
MSKPLVSSTPMKYEKSDCSLLTNYTEVPTEDSIAGPDEIAVCIEKIPVKRGLNETEDSDSTLSSDASSNMLFNSFVQIHVGVSNFYKSNHSHIKTGMYVSLGVLYLAYFVAAMVISQQQKIKDPTPLIVVTMVTVVCITIWLVKKMFGRKISEKLVLSIVNVFNQRQKLIRVIQIVLCFLLVVAAIIVTAFSVWDRPRNLVSICGYVLLLFVLLVCSVHPTKVIWRPVLGGLALQFFFAALILKTDVGQAVFEFLGTQVQTFLSFTNTGTKFVFGDKYTDHPFAMMVLPVIVFFSCAISVLYYIGAMQVVISKIAWVMRVGLGTSAPESLCAAGNIFIGQTEAPILIRPFLALMTKSELHAVMTGGFATIAGGVLAAYISFGVSAEHLLCASVMNAPCALAVSKLLYPETETSKLNKASDLDKEERKERNILEAAAAGASSSIKLVANIAANLIAFLAMLEFVNAVLSWFGGFVGYPEFSFQLICSYVLRPLAYLMGVQWDDCGIVGELIGIKTFLNEFLAYGELSTYLKNRELCIGRILAVRSEIIATYALCGFANLSSIGIQLGALGPMAPSRKGDLAQIVLRALLGGIVTSLLTACIAGLLVTEPITQLSCINSTVVNATMTPMLNTTSTLTFVTRIIEQTTATSL